MTMIQLLDQELINKIAAGEVVERPASVVKELIENSLDAQASEIILDIEQGGLDLIRVTDNGKGMSAEDAKMSLLRHATSKVSTLQDLQTISTLGFRGEALAAISAVSQFRLLTKESDILGATEVIYREGGMVVKPTSGRNGTIVEVRGLFHSVPARKKFMKSASTEFRHINQIITQQAILSPLVAWRLLHNGKEILNLRKVTDIKDRIIDIIGSALSNEMIEVQYQRASLAIKGFVLHPANARPQMKEQYLFVNGRPVSDYIVSKAVKQGFHNQIPHDSRPGFILQISIAPDLVDVNVHPRKSEVRFADSAGIFREVVRAVTLALEGAAINPVSFSKNQAYSTISRSPSTSRTSYQLKTSKQKIKKSMDFQKRILSQPVQPISDSFFSKPESSAEESLIQDDGWKLIGQVHDSYIIAESEEGMVIVDQHAVAEKILYEELMAHLSEPKIQSLLVPVLIELSADQKVLVSEHVDSLQSMGIEGELFGGNSYRLSGVPQNIKSNDIKTFFLGVLDDMNDDSFTQALSLQKRQEELAKIASCRGAIKFGDPLTEQEQKQLLRDLKRLDIVACCHGRPATMKLTKEQLNKQFKRP